MANEFIVTTFKNGFTFLRAIVAQNAEQSKRAKNGNFLLALFLNKFTWLLNCTQLWMKTNFRDCYVEVKLGKDAISCIGVSME